MKKPTPFLLAAGGGVMCLLGLIWPWRQGETSTVVTDTRSVAGAPGETPNEPSPSRPPRVADPKELSPAMRSMLADLMRALISGNAREREAVLAFKDDAALNRFLQRAAK